MDEQRGERIQGAATHRVQVRTIRPHEFTRAKREVFLNTLAATCNVTTAAKAAGICRKTATNLRRRLPEFDRLWAEALETGYGYLEEQLLARAIEGLDALAIDPEAAPVPPLPPLAGPGAGSGAGSGAAPAPRGGAAQAGGAGNFAGRGLPPAYQLALMILNQRRAAGRDGPRNRTRKVLTTIEVNALLVKKLDDLDRLDAVARGRVERAAAAAAAVGREGGEA